jgi:hypothetical protein
MLTPMQVQYVVGLCCLRRNPDAVDVTVGDLVHDEAADKERDVDVTVTLRDDDGSVSAFKAYEAKREGLPLDVTTVEQLCVKLKDMPTVTHRAIVSASGFSKGAIKKANTHSVTLYSLKPWTRPLSEQFPEFSNVGRPEEFLAEFQSILLYWVSWKFGFTTKGRTDSFTWPECTRLLAADGGPHAEFPTMKELQLSLLQRSTDILVSLEPAQTIHRTFPLFATVEADTFASTPMWPHTHTLDIRGNQVFLKVDAVAVQLIIATISGMLQWRRRKSIPQFYVLETVPSGDIFAAAAVADYGADDGRMFAMIFPPHSRTLGIHQFRLLEKHTHAIRKLKIPILKS